MYDNCTNTVNTVDLFQLYSSEREVCFLISLNYRDAKPIYEQICDGFRKLILSGVLKAEEKLPSVRALASELTINPNTIQRAYNTLEAEGYIYSVSGKGSFVCGDLPAAQTRKNELLRQLREVAAELQYLNVSREEILSIFEEEEKKND